MPLVGGLLLLAERAVRAAAVDFAEELGADSGDLLVRVTVATDLAFGVEDGVDVQARGGRAAGELADFEDELFLEVVGEVILCAEPDDAA